MTRKITFHIGKIVPRVLREFDIYIDKRREFTSKQTTTILKGKNDKRPSYYMKNYVNEYTGYYSDLDLNIIKAIEDILEEIIKDMIVYDKSLKRKNNFFNTLDSISGQTFIFVIGIICLGEAMIEEYGYIRNGRYLECVLRAKKELATSIKEL